MEIKGSKDAALEGLYKWWKVIGNSMMSVKISRRSRTYPRITPRILEQLIEISEKEHEPVRPGEIYDREIMEKDRKQAPHKRKTKPKKRPIDE